MKINREYYVRDLNGTIYAGFKSWQARMSFMQRGNWKHYFEVTKKQLDKNRKHRLLKRVEVDQLFDASDYE